MFERFTDRARKVMALANQEAQRFNHEYIGTEHILLGLVKEGSGVGANVLKNLDVDLRKVRLEVEKLVKRGPDMVTMGKLPQTPRAKKVIEYAIEEARSLNHNYVGTEHLLLGLLREQDGVAAQVLMNLGAATRGCSARRSSISWARVSRTRRPPPRSARRRPQEEQEQDARLSRFFRPRPDGNGSRGQTRPGDRATARDRPRHPILCRRQKNNPVLLGEAGVGKTAIVEGLAQKIRQQRDPRATLPTAHRGA
jgi:ATP-dependent Clp protease ATP-binding subunit ClpC